MRVGLLVLTDLLQHSTFNEGLVLVLTKWQIHHEGGGWCTSVADCYGRSQTGLGSSKGYTATIDLPFGYMSNSRTVNPMMYNWNKVYLKYCDGASFSGSNATVTKYEGHNLFFRGLQNRQSYLAALKKTYGFDQATDIVIGGCSAGGLATYLHVDWWRGVAPSSARLVGLPDSGFFLDYDAPGSGPKYATDMKWVYYQNNATNKINVGCEQNYPTNPYMCFFAEHVAPFIKSPIFPLQSEYDSWSTANILGSKDPAQINSYGKMLTQRFNDNVLKNTKNGGFLDSCFHHCNGWSLSINGKNAATIFDPWYRTGTNGVAIAGQVYPCDACCKL